MDQKLIQIPFAVSGDQTAIAAAAQSDGSVSFTQGWTSDYQADQSGDPTAKDIDRATMNYLFYVITLALAQYQSYGSPEWITAADNGGIAFVYAKNAVVRYRATTAGVFVTYQSAVDANTSVPGADANWQLIPETLKIQGNSYNYAPDTGVAGAAVVTLSPALVAEIEGPVFTFEVAATNPGPTTIQFNARPVKNLFSLAGVALEGGELVAGGIARTTYSATLGQYVLLGCTNGQPRIVTQPQFDASTKAASTAFVRRVGLQYRGLNAYTASRVLTSADLGSLVFTHATSPIGITMPLASQCPAGTLIQIVNNNFNSASITFLLQGSDVFSMPSVALATLVMGANDDITFMSNGVSTWLAVGGSARLAYSGAFKNSLFTIPGWRYTPEGRLVQWGNGVVPASGVTSASIDVFLPIAFGSTVFNVTVTPTNVSNSTKGAWPSSGMDVARLSRAQFGVVLDTLGFAVFNNNVGFMWQAEGY